MQISTAHFSNWKGDILALLAGAIIPFSFAPYNIWQLGIIGSALLAFLLQGLTARKSFWRALVFGFGLFVSGASWVYVSIHDFGFASPALAVLLTGLFVGTLAIVFACPFYVYSRYVPYSNLNTIFVFPAFWVLGEWSRTWFLTGFPWLFSGYAHIETWLAGWAPIFGVFGVSYLSVCSGIALSLAFITIFQQQKGATKSTAIFSLLSLGIWAGGHLLHKIEWTSYSDQDKVTVSLVQPNIPQEMKWDPKYQPFITETLLKLSETSWDSDIVIWPEAAIPYLFHEAPDFLKFISEQAHSSQTMLITGMLYDSYNQETSEFKYYNSILGLGAGKGTYFKQRLVPFGEYVPLEKYLRGLIAFFDLPNSIIHRGPRQNNGLDVQLGENRQFRISPYICYEIVYPDLVAENAENAQILVTISNDAWFGDSVGPIQHFEMAQMRALENGRFVIRATNTGLSGLINQKGQVTHLGHQFKRETTTGLVYRTHGRTPYSYWHSLPIISFCFIIILGSFTYHQTKTHNAKKRVEDSD